MTNEVMDSPQEHQAITGPAVTTPAVTTPAVTTPAVTAPAVNTFVHQRNRLTEGQQSAWDRDWPQLGRDVSELVSGAVAYEPSSWFGRTAPLIMEIGSGMGEASAALAIAEPDIDHLAVEVFEPGLAQLLMRIDDAGLTNIALLRGDAVALLRARIPSASLDGLRIWFPDPWPKRRHRKRRIVQPDFVALATSRLRPGALLHLATDWADYAEQMREVCERQTGLNNTAGAGEWTPRPEWRPLTKFEERAHREGRDVRDLVYQADPIRVDGADRM